MSVDWNEWNEWGVEYTPIVGIDGWNEGRRDRDGDGEVEREGKHMMCIVCGGGGIWWDYWELF